MVCRLLLVNFVLASLVGLITCQLVVNFRNRGGQTLVEKILANTTADTIKLDLLASDGTFVTQFIDFKSEIQIFRLHVLGEEELGQTEPQVLCFLSRFQRNDFISSDAMSKLRQKNPTAIRTPEEEKEMHIHNMDLSISLDKAHYISPHIFNICAEAKDNVYAQEMDLRTVSKSLGKDYTNLVYAATEMKPIRHKKCRELDGQTLGSKPCTCQLRVCVGWYPCGLKYCHGTDTSGRVVSYRCGIKTCKRCLTFAYVAGSKAKCLWDLV